MSSVNNENNSRIFQFISSQGAQISQADANGDNVVTKKELKNFLEEIGFDYASLEGWDGTDKTNNDLFAQFFNSINSTSTKSKIKGSKVKESAGLNSNEIANAESRIKAQEYLDTFIEDNLSIPEFINDQAGFKKEVTEKLEALIEKELIKKNKAVTEDSVEKLLDEQFDKIQNETAAEIFSSEHVAEAMADYVKDYDYKVADDKTLQKLIKDFVASVDGETDMETIKSEIEAIVNKYIATTKAGKNISSKAVLNDLQKAVLTKGLTNAIIAQIKDSEIYKNNKEVYDALISQFVATQLMGAQSYDLLAEKSTVLAAFEQQRKAIESKVQAKGIFQDSEFLAQVTSEISADIAEKIQNIMPGELSSLDKLKAMVEKKVLGGEFVNADGSLNKTELTKWIISELKTMVTDFYGGKVTSEMSVAQLEQIYDGAITEGTSTAIKKAAKDFCNAIASKGGTFKTAVENIFGENFSSKIDSLYAYQIKTMITELRTAISTLTEPVIVKDKSASVKEAVKSQASHSGNLDFYVNDKGEIVFVTRTTEAHGSFNNNNTINSALKAKIDTLKTRLESAYASDLTAIKLSDVQKKALFNAALFVALSDPSVVKSQYENTTDLTKLFNAVIDNYTKLLQKVAKDENAMNFIQNYTSNSILAGRTPAPADNYTFGGEEWSSSWQIFRDDVDIELHSDCKKGIQRYYADDSTYGNDDWIRLSSYTNTQVSHQHNGKTITILESSVQGDAQGDVNALNKAMRTLAEDYVDAYGSMIDTNRLCELFRQAQETAYSKINSLTDQSNAANSSVYGYGEVGSVTDRDPSDNFDTAKNDADGMLVNIGNVILQVMFEMERLIALEMMK